MKNKTQPNLIYIFADQLRYQSCGFAGDDKARTPHIDRLADESLNFYNAVSGHPMCAPYRASLFTGKYTTSTGMIINELRLNPKQRAFGHVLTDGGYETYYIGKWHLWANELGNHYHPKNSFTPPGPDRFGFDGYWAAYNFHHHYYDVYYHLDSPEKILVEGYEPDAQTDLAIAKVQEAAAKDSPFVLFLSYGTPHDPWTTDNVPPEYLALFTDVEFPLPANYKPENDPYADKWAVMDEAERAALPDWMWVYYAMTANLDWNLGRLLQAVDEAGLRDNTILVFTSDHGEMFGAQGRRAKNIFYEEAVRVPFLIRWPGQTPAGQATDVCLNTVDIMPTLLSLMGLPVPDGVEGMDLSDWALGRTGVEPPVAFMQGTGATAIWEDGHEWRAVRSKQYTYATYLVDGSELLFDNLADPGQLHNLIDSPDHQDIRNRLRTLLAEKMTAVNDSFQPCTWYRDHWTKDRLILRTATLGP